MFWNRDPEAEKLKKELKQVNADMGTVKDWLKLYARTKKKAAACLRSYTDERQRLEQLLDELKSLEQMVIGYGDLSLEQEAEMETALKHFRKERGAFDNEFLISREDRDFHTTLESVEALGSAYVKRHENGVLFQSEIENLIAITEEGLCREKPDLFALGFFYLEHTNAELADMTFSRKAERITEVYDEKFREPILKQMMLLYKENGEQAHSFAEIRLASMCHI